MSVPVIARFSIAVGMACLLASAMPPFDLASLACVVTGVLNLGCAALVIHEARQ